MGGDEIGSRGAGEPRPAARLRRHPPRVGRRGRAARRERYRPLALDLPGHGDAADAPRPITFAGCVAARARRQPRALRAVRLLARRARRAARRAGRARARGAAGAGRGQPRDRGSRASAPRGDARTARSPTISNAGPTRSSSSAGAPSRCSPTILPRSGRWRARISAATGPTRWPPSCAGLGAGEMQPLWDRLAELAMPVTVLVGERDEKFLALGRRMVELLPTGELVVVPGGHGLPLESPAASWPRRFELASCG